MAMEVVVPAALAAEQAALALVDRAVAVAMVVEVMEVMDVMEAAVAVAVMGVVELAAKADATADQVERVVLVATTEVERGKCRPAPLGRQCR